MSLTSSTSMTVLRILSYLVFHIHSTFLFQENDIMHHEFVILILTTTRNADSRRVKNKYARMNKRNVRIFMNELKYLHLFPYNHIDQESKPKMCDIPLRLLYDFYLFLLVVAARSYTNEVIICIR